MAGNEEIRASSIRANSPLLPPGIGAVVLFSIALGIGLITLFMNQRAMPNNSNSGTSSSTSSQTSQGAPDKKLRTKASWYGPGFQGRMTSTGEAFDQNKLTAAAASAKIPLGSTAEIRNLQNGRKVDVKINDCGPSVAGRKIDLSSRAAKSLDMKHSGVVPVEVKVVHKPADSQPCPSK